MGDLARASVLTWLVPSCPGLEAPLQSTCLQGSNSLHKPSVLQRGKRVLR